MLAVETLRPWTSKYGNFKIQYEKKPEPANEACEAMAKHYQIARLMDKLHEQGDIFNFLGSDLLEDFGSLVHRAELQ